jgi:hypothetical protein
MGHFSASQWVDLLRGVANSATSDAMNRHLQRGCAECERDRLAWQRLVDFATRERAVDPPEDAVRVAKSYWASYGLARDRRAREASVVATLVFDSLRQGLPAGVRASTTTGRHLMYEAPPFVIDLQVEPSARSSHVVLAGQIVATAGPRIPRQQPRVRLSNGANELITLDSNEFGEFQCEFEPQPDLSLLISIPEHTILIPLGVLSETTPDATRGPEK